ncbi:MAG: APC family permease [Alphaproteobacteria bacterium]|nr:APC family permease [Alphaproteobacteria bacterium]
MVGLIVLLSAIAWVGVRERLCRGPHHPHRDRYPAGGDRLWCAAHERCSEDRPRVRAPGDAAVLGAILSGSVIAFFAFIGFEDIENMAEETIDPETASPRAVF